MKKVYTINGEDYRQEVMSVDQIKVFLKLLKELGIGQLINAGQFDFNQIFDQIIEHDKVELFMATMLIPNSQIGFNRQEYDKNLQRFGVCSGELLAEVVEDFLSFNEPWFARLNKQMGKMKAPAETEKSSMSMN